jgi:hypothetical protein
LARRLKKTSILAWEQRQVASILGKAIILTYLSGLNKIVTWTVFVQVPPVRLAAKERITMLDGQLEMSFGQAGQFTARRQRRQSRAQWWFQRMRQIVDRATDWQPVRRPDLSKSGFRRPRLVWNP